MCESRPQKKREGGDGGGGRWDRETGRLGDETNDPYDIVR